MSEDKRQDTGGDPVIRKPTPEDGAGMWELVKHTGVLDVNSAYLYIVLAAHFSASCSVAISDDRVVGMVTGYLYPDRRDTLFIWQVAVHGDMRGHGLAGKLLDAIVSRPELRPLQWLETTVSPSNAASQRMFAKLAQRLNADLNHAPGFPARLFPGANHEDEPLIRIGPFDQTSR